MNDLNEIIREALHLHDVFRRMGFAADQIFVELARIGNPSTALFHERTRLADLTVNVVLMAQGLEFRGSIGPIPVSPDEFDEAWTAAVGVFNAAKEEDRVQSWERSKIKTILEPLVMGLQMKGFHLPFVVN